MNRYKHNCSSCTYLGQFDKYDLYYHNIKTSNLPMIMARWSDKISDYTLWMPESVIITSLNKDIDAALKEAYKRAKKFMKTQ